MLGFCLNLRFKGVVGMVYEVFTFKEGKTQFRGLCLSPLSRALGQLSKYEIKRGVISFLDPLLHPPLSLFSLFFYLLAKISLTLQIMFLWTDKGGVFHIIHFYGRNCVSLILGQGRERGEQPKGHG